MPRLFLCACVGLRLRSSGWCLAWQECRAIFLGIRMTIFNHAVQVVLNHEGGYVNHASDPGGVTNYGISLRWLQAQGELDGVDDFDIDGDGDIDADDIKQMTVQDARDFYFRFWWSKYNYHLILDSDIATKVFDMAVNMGSRQAHKLVQRAARADGQLLKDDGILGPKSFRGINACNADVLLGALRVECKCFYKMLIRQKPDFAVFEAGWLVRAYS